MTGTSTPEPLFVDTEVAFSAHARVADGDPLTAVRTAYNRAARALLGSNRTAVQIEVIIRVAP
jgi:hypothetical protein